MCHAEPSAKRDLPPNYPMRLPPALRPGDLVTVIAPSGPFEPILGWRGLGWLSERYRVRYSRSVFCVQGYLAGDRHRRAQELIAALGDPDSRAIVAMRGGYGLHHIAYLPDWDAFAQRPQWIVGFSDITALHVETAAVGVMSLHAPMVALLGRGHSPSRSAWIDALEHPQRPRRWDGLATLATGRANGTLFGGNLTVLHSCAVAGRLRIPPGAVLLLEDIGERPYRIDRMLTTLWQGGHLQNVSAIVLGDFVQCDPGSDGVAVAQVLRELLTACGVPVIGGLPVGHGLRNDPLLLGAHATVDATGDVASLCVNVGPARS